MRSRFQIWCEVEPNYFTHHSQLSFFFFLFCLLWESIWGAVHFYIPLLFGVRPKCLKLWVFRLGMRGLFLQFVVTFSLWTKAKRRDGSAEERPWESSLNEVECSSRELQLELIVQKFKICCRFWFVCGFVLFPWKRLWSWRFQFQSSMNSLL